MFIVMSKIRINVLAREMEVKSHLILEALPELGITEKMTHSSSIDDDLAARIRHHFGIPSSHVSSQSAALEPFEEPLVAHSDEPAPVVPPADMPEPVFAPRPASTIPTEPQQPEAQPDRSARPVSPLR